MATILITSAILSGCSKATKSEPAQNTTTTNNQSTVSQTSPPEEKSPTTPTTTPENNTLYDIKKVVYTDKNAKISYPQVSNLSNEKKQEVINQLIKNDILKSFYGGEENGLTWEVDYKVKLQDANLLSIVYSGIRNNKGTPHPTRMYYTTNIDVSKGIKLTLSDIVNINKNLTVLFKKADLIGIDNKEMNSAIGGYVGKIDANDLVKYFNQSDGVPSTDENESGTFSYLTKDALGISVQTIYACGDHAEFEIKYKDLADNLKSDNATLNTFFGLQKK
ncbi:MAG: hypothetical protein P4L69_20235 [Desulfosporosinus sp.]|nr:hypothetical protein [Desulfosporosinus sp.]